MENALIQWRKAQERWITRAQRWCLQVGRRRELVGPWLGRGGARAGTPPGWFRSTSKAAGRGVGVKRAPAPGFSACRGSQQDGEGPKDTSGLRFVRPQSRAS